MDLRGQDRMALVLDPFHAPLSHGDDGFISGDPQGWVHVFGSLDGPWFSAAGALSHSLVGDVTHGRQDHPADLRGQDLRGQDHD